MPGNIGSFMTAALNSYTCCGKADVNKKYQYKPEGDVTGDMLRKALSAEADKFTKAVAKNGKQITEKDFVNYFKENMYKGYDEKVVRQLYKAINFNTGSGSKGLDTNEISSFLMGMDFLDGKITGDVNQENVIGTYGLVGSGKQADVATLFKLLGEQLKNNQ